MRAAEYTRMSTEHQQYSIENQRAAIAAYAESSGIEIVKRYSDPARSGLDLARRPGLRQLLQDIISGTTDYEAVLVYDVSRWGRFQDTDESAYYEFLCKRAGVCIHYCAELFGTDTGLLTTLFKTLKRAMAAEFIRELSLRVFAAQCRIANNGYKMGGQPGYALDRMMLGSDGSAKGILAPGERKNYSRDRVVYVAGPPEEVAVVQDIFTWFLDDGLLISSIAKRLTSRGVPRRIGSGQWTYWAVKKILESPKYAGYVVFGRTTQKLGTKPVRLPPEQWVVAPNAFEPLVSPERFHAAQERMKPLSRRSNEEMLDALRWLLQRKGKITANLMRGTSAVPSPDAYRKRFGSLQSAYEGLGNEARSYVKGNMLKSRFRLLMKELVAQLMAALHEVGLESERVKTGMEVSGFGLLRLEIGHFELACYGPRWDVRLRGLPTGRALLVARLSANLTAFQDLVLLEPPPMGVRNHTISSRDSRGAIIFPDSGELVRYLCSEELSNGLKPS